MKAILFFLLASLCFTCYSQTIDIKIADQFNPPATKIIPVTDTYFGMKVTDNYRWLENMKDPEVLNWFKKQSDYTNRFLDKIPGRDSLVADFEKLDALSPTEISDIIRKKSRYFFRKTLHGEKVGKLYYRDGKNGKDNLLYDPGVDNAGVPFSLNSFTVSEDGSKVALCVTKGGAEVSRIYTMDVATKKIDPQSIFPSWGVFSWSPDNKGFLYLKLNTADNKSMNYEMNTKTMYHFIGANPAADKEIFSKRKYPNLGIDSVDICTLLYSEDFKYIFGIPASVSSNIKCFYAPAADLLKPKIAWKSLLKGKDQVTKFCVDDDDIYMLTHHDAPQFKVLKSNLKNFSFDKAEVVVPEAKDKISYLARSKDYLFLSYSDGINSTAKKYNLHSGNISAVSFPMKGSGIRADMDTRLLVPFGIHANDGLISLVSWKQPLTVFDYNADNNKAQLSSFNTTANYPGLGDIVVIETEVPGYDGTMVPLSIVYNKNVKLDGNANCLIRGYGAYGISITPFFSPLIIGLVNRGVVFATAHVRGGGEKGEAWHKAGFKTTKPNTWKDLIACAEYLTKNKYTSAAKLTAMGTSAGGITTTRAITERPDLFGAAIDNVGVSDALRVENSPNGPNNIPEFGTTKDSIESVALYNMDGLQHVKDGVKYPAVIAVCGIHDPRVIAWQPAKFAAAVQHASSSGKPVFLDVNYDNGHFTEDKSVTFTNFANMFAFALWQTGNPAFQMKDNSYSINLKWLVIPAFKLYHHLVY